MAEQLTCEVQIGVRDVDVRLAVEQGSTMALLGSNGAGKSSVLEAIAGLLRPDVGRIAVGERRLCDTEAGIELPAYARRVGLLAQRPALLPHLSVTANVAFGPRAHGMSRARAKRLAAEWLERVGAAEFGGRRPGQLSGGQAQRVALARVLATDPQVMLLDEPLAALDVDVAAQMRRLLAEVLRTRTTMLVTHDLLDVVSLADRVAVLEGGRVVEEGPSAQVLSAPRSQFAGSLAGVNLIEGHTGPDSALEAGPIKVYSSAEALAPGSAAVAVFRPEAVTVHRRRPEGSARNVWQVEVTELAPLHHGVRIRARAGSIAVAADITAAAAAELDCGPTDRVWFSVKAYEVGIHPA